MQECEKNKTKCNLWDFHLRIKNVFTIKQLLIYKYNHFFIISCIFISLMKICKQLCFYPGFYLYLLWLTKTEFSCIYIAKTSKLQNIPFHKLLVPKRFYKTVQLHILISVNFYLNQIITTFYHYKCVSTFSLNLLNIRVIQ